jgi:maleylacetoacetate isomerase/maleylpyruvate isomerase
MLASDTHPLVTPRVRKFLSTNAGLDDAAVRAWMRHWFSTGLAAVEQRLGT